MKLHRAYYRIPTPKIIMILGLLLLCYRGADVAAQTIDEIPVGDNIYEKTLRKQILPPPLQHVRESDVIWSSMIWRTIDMREKFNQFFYFPTEKDGVDGRKNIAYTIWDAIVSGEIPIYEDDELKIPLDNDAFLQQYTKIDTVILEIEDDDENYEYQTVLVPREFLSDEIFQIRLKEVWFIDKQADRQLIRYIGMALTQDIYKEYNGELEFTNRITLCWIPMQSFAVRTLLERHEAYYEDNIAHLPSWRQILESRRYDSFINRESNRMNRSISDYLTGIDAILESERIETKLLDISSDMWEY